MDTRSRILEATKEVLARNGHQKLSVNDVAKAAAVSRPTFYRWFASKEELLAAFGPYEQRKFDDGMAAQLLGLTGLDALDAALQFIVTFQRSDPMTGMVEVEPEHVLSQMDRVLPIMRAKLAPLIDDPDRINIAGAIVRIAISHYAVRGDDDEAFLAQLRHAAGIVIS